MGDKWFAKIFALSEMLKSCMSHAVLYQSSGDTDTKPRLLFNGRKLHGERARKPTSLVCLYCSNAGKTMLEIFFP